VISKSSAGDTRARVMFITPDLSSNSLGRTHCLWMLASELGWSSAVVSAYGDAVWKPLRDSAFSQVCRTIDISDDREFGALVAETLDYDLIVCVKPVNESLGLASRLAARSGVGLLVDIDDPDLDAVLAVRTPFKRLAKWIFRTAEMRRARQLWNLAHAFPVTTSNPYLQDRHGGWLVPHVRVPPTVAHTHESTAPSVAFVGTNRAHKGVAILRDAVGQLAHAGYRLTITDVEPPNPPPWESWIGPTSLEDGATLVVGTDIVAIPSLNGPWAWGQLPAKLIDAMMAGCAVVVSDISPLTWAIGKAGVIVPAGDVDALAAALKSLSDPRERARLGSLARSRAKELFTVDVVVGQFAAACRVAIGPTGPGDRHSDSYQRGSTWPD
jgi:hypothetical protein